MMLDKVIEKDSLRSTQDGASLGLRLPWYRALPLSTVDIDALKIDGQPVAPERISLSVNGGRWPIGELRQRTDQNWYVTDTATLEFDGVALEPGSTHEVEVTVSMYPPYIRGLRRAVRWSQAMEVRA
jgi:hypothetical protein